MKRMTILLALLLAGMLAAASVMSWGLPDTENLVPGPVERADGTVLAAENRWFTSRIYTLQEGGDFALIRSVEFFEDYAEGGRRQAAALEDGACFIRILNDGADWELVKLENGKAELLHRDTFENEVTVTGLQVQGESFWITAVGANEAIFIYEYTATDGVGLKMILPAWWLWKTVTAEYDGEVIRATTAYGDTCFLTPSGGCTYSDEAAEALLPAVNAEGGGWLLCKKAVLLTALLLWLVIAVVLLIADAISRRANRLANRLTAVGGAAVLLALEAPFGVAFSVIFTEESPTSFMYFGFFLIFVAVVCSETKFSFLRRKSAKA